MLLQHTVAPLRFVRRLMRVQCSHLSLRLITPAYFHLFGLFAVLPCDCFACICAIHDGAEVYFRRRGMHTSKRASADVDGKGETILGRPAALGWEADYGPAGKWSRKPEPQGARRPGRRLARRVAGAALGSAAPVPVQARKPEPKLARLLERPNQARQPGHRF